MGSYGGHVLPGSFFVIFGFWYTLKYSYAYLRGKSPVNDNVFYCCKKRIPLNGLVIEGVVKIVMISIGILVELFYPGTSPNGRLHNSDGEYTNPMNWQHATMYFWFGISGIADIITFAARHIIPAGLDRVVGGMALFIEGYLFFFHLHGRSHIDTRVHILLVLAVWPSALFAFLQCLVMKKRGILHTFEMLMSTLVIVQGTWFWQAAYILYPPGGESWDPCSRGAHDESHHGHDAGGGDCNAGHEAETNLMFLTLFWSWHLAAALCFVSIIYAIMYRYLKCTGRLDASFLSDYRFVNGGASPRGPPVFAGKPLLTDEEEEL